MCVGAIGAVDFRFNVSDLSSGFFPALHRRTYRNREFDAFFQDTWAFRKTLRSISDCGGSIQEYLTRQMDLL